MRHLDNIKVTFKIFVECFLGFCLIQNLTYQILPLSFFKIDTKRNQLLQGTEVGQSETKLLKNLTFAHVKSLDPSRNFLKDRQLEKYNSSHAKRLVDSRRNTSKASQSHTISSFKTLQATNFF